MTKLEGKLLEIIDRQSRVIDQQQQQLEELRGTVSSLREELARICRSLRDQQPSSPRPGYQYDSDKIPMNPCTDKDPLNIRGPSDWPPAPWITCDNAAYIGAPGGPKDDTYVGGIITVTPDPDHLPYGYDPKDPLNSRRVSLNARESFEFKEYRAQ